MPSFVARPAARLRCAPPHELLAPVYTRFYAARRWAIARSPSLVGLLYLPAPEDPVAAPRPRHAPTPLRPLPSDLVERREVVFDGTAFALAPPIGWRTDPEPRGLAELHTTEEVLALLRLAANGGAPGAAELSRRIALDWIEHNPVASRPGWRPSPLSRRLACWSQALAEQGGALPSQEQVRWRQSLFVQARYLAANLAPGEPSPWGVAALRGLLGAASVLAGTEPRAWFERALALLPRVIDRQVLEDGGHRSRRPSAQRRALGDLLDAVSLLPPESSAFRHARASLPAMARFARALSHPDGTPAGFGLCPAAQAPSLAALLGDTAPPDGCFAFQESGFTALHRARHQDACLVDWLGPLDGDRPGEALGFELSWSARRFVATPTGAAQGAACLRHVAWGEGPGFDYLGLACERSEVRRQRRLLWLHTRALAVIDRVQGEERRACTRIALDREVKVAEAGPRRLYLERDGVTATFAWMPGARLVLETVSVLGPRGEQQEATGLRLEAPGGGDRLLGFLIAEGRRADAAIDLLDGAEERIGLRFDPRRTLLRWQPPEPPRLIFAD